MGEGQDEGDPGRVLLPPYPTLSLGGERRKGNPWWREGEASGFFHANEREVESEKAIQIDAYS